MNEFFSAINFDQMLEALYETLFMSFGSLLFAVLIGLVVGILLYCTQSGGLYENKVINPIADLIVNVLRAVPFIILLILIIPLITISVCLCHDDLPFLKSIKNEPDIRLGFIIGNILGFSVFFHILVDFLVR